MLPAFAASASAEAAELSCVAFAAAVCEALSGADAAAALLQALKRRAERSIGVTNVTDVFFLNVGSFM